MTSSPLSTRTQTFVEWSGRSLFVRFIRVNICTTTFIQLGHRVLLSKKNLSSTRNALTLSIFLFSPLKCVTYRSVHKSYTTNALTATSGTKSPDRWTKKAITNPTLALNLFKGGDNRNTNGRTTTGTDRTNDGDGEEGLTTPNNLRTG